MTISLFIDANQYLTLYGLISGKTLLDSLEEQKEHIFVSRQTVDEVLRNKLDCSRAFFLNTLNEVREIDSSVPDHLLGIPNDEISELRKRFGEAKEARSKLTKLAGDALQRISRSEDDVTRRPDRLFDGAISPSAVEMERARQRKELGSHPGNQKIPWGTRSRGNNF